MDGILRPAPRRVVYVERTPVLKRPVLLSSRPALDTSLDEQAVLEDSFFETNLSHETVVPSSQLKIEDCFPESLDTPVQYSHGEEVDDQPAKAIVHNKLLRPRFVIGATGLLFVMVMALAVLRPGQSQIPTVLAAHDNSNSRSRAAMVAPDITNIIPEEKPPTNYVESYTVAPNLPRIITIERLGISTRIIPVGADGRSQPQTPKHGYDVGWYNVGARFGESGAAVVSGACSAPGVEGVFSRLGELKPEDVIKVEKGDGTHLSYSVKIIDTVAVEKLDMAQVLRPANNAVSGLNIVTCSGEYNAFSNDHANRTVVYAVQN